MTKDEALRLALEALKHGGCPPDCKDGMTDSGGVHPWGEAALIPCPNCKTIAACEKALEQPEREPVAWGVDWGNAGDSPCVSIIKRLPDGVLEVVAVEYGPKREPLTWQPIATAPKETEVLVYGDGATHVARLVPNGWAIDDGGGLAYINTPTHWMPLPKPPIEAAHRIKGEA